MHAVGVKSGSTATTTHIAAYRRPEHRLLFVVAVAVAVVVVAVAVVVVENVVYCSGSTAVSTRLAHFSLGSLGQCCC